MASHRSHCSRRNLRRRQPSAVRDPAPRYYRRIPAVTFAKQLIDDGRLGRVFHYRAEFLQDWTINSDLPQGGEALWRLDAKAAGIAAINPAIAGIVDLATPPAIALASPPPVTARI